MCKVFFLLLRSVGRRDLSAGPEQKQNTTQGCFFLLRPRGKAGEGEAPCRRPTGLLLALPFPRTGAKKKTPGWCFFCSGPVPAPNGASPSLAFRRGRSQKKKHPGWCSFFCSGPVPARGFSFPCLSPGPEQKKKNTPGWCFFFAAAPRGRSLTHCGPGWRCLPLAGVVFFFLLRPRRVFLDNNKKCLGYYIESKKTRRGHSKKKTPLPDYHVGHAKKLVSSST